MRALGAAFLSVWLMMLASSAFAETGEGATYVSGSLPQMKSGLAGTLDMTAPASLNFSTSGSQLSIPFSAIATFEYREESRFHLGVLPAIAVALVKKRAKVHFVTVTWTDEAGVAQVASLEMSKGTAFGLMSVLRARAVNANRLKTRQAATPAKPSPQPAP